MNDRRAAVAVSAALVMTALGVVAPAPAAASATVEVLTATVLARGAAVDLRVRVTCNDRTVVESGSQWEVRQVQGQRVVLGHGGDDFDYVCDSRPHVRTLRVHPQGGIFRSTSALVYFRYYSCPGGDGDSVGECTDADVSTVLRLRR